MRIKLLFVLTMLIPICVLAQKKQKPKMLVYGSDITAFCAAIQSAKSNVPTIWVLDGEVQELLQEITKEPLKIRNNTHLDGGIWMNLLMKMAISKTSNDSLAQIVKGDFSPILARNAILKMIEENPNLTLIKGQKIIKSQRRRKDWQITLSNKQTFRVLTVVDASVQGRLYAESQPVKKDSVNNFFLTAKELSLPLSRTSLGAAEINDDVHVILLQDLLAFEHENVFDLGFLRTMEKNPESLAFRASYGQALGALAAYCAFFKTDTKALDIRKLQAELLSFAARISPYQDIKADDPHFAATQKFYLTGVFLGQQVHNQYVFNQGESVRFDEIKPVLNNLYTRSQLWFLDNYRDDVLLWSDLLSLIKFISFKGDEVETQVKKDWSVRRKFTGDFNLKKPVNRRQFAVMMDLYSTAFAKAIDKEGHFIK